MSRRWEKNVILKDELDIGLTRDDYTGNKTRGKNEIFESNNEIFGADFAPNIISLKLLVTNFSSNHPYIQVI